MVSFSKQSICHPPESRRPHLFSGQRLSRVHFQKKVLALTTLSISSQRLRSLLRCGSRKSRQLVAQFFKLWGILFPKLSDALQASLLFPLRDQFGARLDTRLESNWRLFDHGVSTGTMEFLPVKDLAIAHHT